MDAMGEALVEDGDSAGQAGLETSGAGAVAAPVQSPRTRPLALSLAFDVGVVAT